MDLFARRRSLTGQELFCSSGNDHCKGLDTVRAPISHDPNGTVVIVNTSLQTIKRPYHDNGGGRC